MGMRVASGARVVIRDAEWLVKTVDRTSTGTLSIRAVGFLHAVERTVADTPGSFDRLYRFVREYPESRIKRTR